MNRPEPATEISPYWTTEDLAVRYHCHVSTITRWRDKYKMPAKQIGRRLLFPKDKILAWEKQADSLLFRVNNA